MEPLHTVIETGAFLKAAGAAGMSEQERAAVVDYMAANPVAGDEMQGTGGCRKVRIAGRGKGKSGGYRVITFFTGSNIPVFLLTVLSKGERSNLSQAERNGLRQMVGNVVEAYRNKVAHLKRG